MLQFDIEPRAGCLYYRVFFMADEHQRVQAQFAEPLRVAMLAVPPLMDPGRYTQAVANNRGVQMKTSESLAELLAWLGV